jgi:hypothetical protein
MRSGIIYEMSWAAGLLSILALGATAACDSAPSAPDASIPEPPPFVPGPNLVTLVSFETPFYIRYRDGDGPWTTPASTSAGTYELHVTNAYDVVALCGGLDRYDAAMLKRTFADGATTFIACYGSGSSGPRPVGEVWEVDGVMQQAGMVLFGGFDFSQFGPWSFSFDVSQGTHDLIAIGDSRMLIRRGLLVDHDMTLAPIDLDVEGLPYDAVPFTSNAVAGVETVDSLVELQTAAEIASLLGTSSELRMPPASLLVAGDKLFATIVASTGTTLRSLRMPFPGSTSITLPPALTGIEVTYPYRQPWVTWGELPPFTELQLSLYSFTSQASQSVSCSASYLAATRTSYLSFYPMPDDYDSRFTVDVVGPYLRSFARYNDTPAGISDYSSLDERVNVP